MPVNKQNIIAGLFDAGTYESITVSTTSQSLSQYTDSDGNLAKRVIITIESSQLRYRYDGTEATSTEGHLVNPFDTIVIVGTDNIKNFRAIRNSTATVDAKIRCTYEY